MTFFPTTYLQNPTQVPPPAGSSPLTRAAAQAGFESSRNLMRQNPLPFAARNSRIGPALLIIPAAIAAWEAFFDEPVPVTPSAGPAGPFPAGGTYNIFGTALWTGVNGNETEPIGSANPPGILSSAITYAAPRVQIDLDPNPDLVRIQLVMDVFLASGQMNTLQLSSSRPVRSWLNVQAVELRIVRLDTPVPQEMPFAPIVPYTAPGPAPIVPTVVPIPLIVRPVPGYLPGPVRVPLLLPDPSRLPSRPIPLLPDPDAPPDYDPDIIPPMTIVPDGIIVGTPTGPAITIPGTGIVTVGTPQTQTEEATRRGTTPCIELDIEPPTPDCCDCEEIREIVIEELDNKFPPKRPNEVDTIEYGSANSRSIELPRFCEYVRLIITDAPDNRKQQSGGDSAPDVTYNGWCAFGSLGTAGERLPINYDDCTYFPPTNARFYSYTLYHGTSATLQVKYRREVQ